MVRVSDLACAIAFTLAVGFFLATCARALEALTG